MTRRQQLPLRELQELDVARQAGGISSEALREKSAQPRTDSGSSTRIVTAICCTFANRRQQRAAKTIDAEFRSFLSEQTPLLLEQLHRAVDDSHGWLASGVAKLAAGRWLKDLGAKLTEWIGSLKPRLEEEINQATGPAKASLESQLAAIPSVAGSVLSGVVDAPLPQTDAEPRATRCICPSSLRDSQSGPRK